MFRPLRTLIWIALIVGFIWFGYTVKLGRYTLFQHLGRIWHSKETQDLVEGTKEKAAPAVDKVKKVIDDGNDRSTATDPQK